MKFNIPNWNTDQWQAAGKHILSYAAGGVSVVVFTGLLSHSQGDIVAGGINDIWNGVQNIIKGAGAIAGVLIPIYTAFKAAHNASPQSRVDAVNKIPGVEVNVSPGASVDAPKAK